MQYEQDVVPECSVVSQQVEVIAIDLGGTHIKAGRFTADGQCLDWTSIETAQPATPEAVIPQMAGLVHGLDPEGVTKAVGIGVPGPTDLMGRRALVAINLQGWNDIPLAERLEALVNKPVKLANDANCAGLGEVWQGAGQGCQLFILLTLGTGVGGAVVIDGQLFTGPKGAGGELGLISIHPDGPHCNSGNRGSLEQHVSATAIRRRTGMGGHELDRRARTGNTEAIAHWRAIGKDLGIGLSSLIYVLTPDVIAIGGGVSKCADLFLPAAIAEIEQRVLPTSREGLKIVAAELGNRAGCVGAAKLALDLL
ncbi:MAG: ROK family protein [Cyanobacteria bacterium P01_E01_bin.34]